ncbi:MAG: carbonic anhydrase [Pseudomonadota bacterium]
MRKTKGMILAALSVSVSMGMGQALASDPHGHEAAGGEKEQVRAIVKNLVEDNAKFVATHKGGYFKEIVKGQHPRATVVTCSDSRVHTHALDKSPDGDLFMVRDIGNQVTTAEGSVEYGVRHLHTPLLIVIGHSACGAVKAAMGDYSSIEAPIKRELDTIKVPGKNAKDDKEVQASVEANVNNQVAFALKKFEPEVKDGKLVVIGGVYDFRNDYNQGHGKLVIINVNGDNDAAKIKAAGILPGK